MGGVLLWGWDTANWQKVIVDAGGHLQVDVLSVPVTDVHLYGYDGANWQTLLVESNTLKNLRVKLYDGANGLKGVLGNAIALQPDDYGLQVAAVLYGWDGVIARRLEVETAGAPNLRVSLYRGALEAYVGEPDRDNWTGNVGALWVVGFNYGFNGSTWDRLRSYSVGILKVGRAEVGLLTVRKTATGQAGATGARKLYWIHENPSAGSGVWELSDATSAGQTVVLDHFSTEREGHMVTFDPPMEFSNGIYLETYTNMTSLVFGYL